MTINSPKLLSVVAQTCGPRYQEDHEFRGQPGQCLWAPINKIVKQGAQIP